MLFLIKKSFYAFPCDQIDTIFVTSNHVLNFKEAKVQMNLILKQPKSKWA